MEKPSPWKSRGRRPERQQFDSLPPLSLPNVSQNQSAPLSAGPLRSSKHSRRLQKSLSLPRQSPPSRKASDSTQPDVTVSVQSASEDLDESSDDGEFGRKVQIDMKGLVGDAVGNMSISPTGRDIVLAARRGMYIIDLNAPEDLPRFLPQGGTWDVADVQWHPSRIEYIVSTSSEKLLIWNLSMSGRTSIEHVLNAHYRAITDINWHPTDPNIVASTGLDSWVWIWDMRALAKPTLGLSAFLSGGTHVKFNRMDEHILASSHMNQVMIWDRRKGSLPVDRIAAHSAKIYGIDWSRHERAGLITCSLDKTIKLWDIGSLKPERNDEDYHTPTSEIYANYPVWRARSLPFGRGLLSLPQRGESTLEMYAHANHSAPVERFDGHSDVVKEFVWRRRDVGTGFQLITWSKDRTLRFWPIDKSTMEKVGYVPEARPPGLHHSNSESIVSFRDQLANTYLPPTVSVPHGHMSIYDQVRATVPTRQSVTGAKATALNESKQRALSPRPGLPHINGPPIAASVPSPSLLRRDTTMSRVVRHARMDPLRWISGIRRDEDNASGTDSGSNSRYGSRSRPPSRVLDGANDNDAGLDSIRRRSSSRDQEDSGYNLREEIASTLNKLAPFKVKLEKLDGKTRTCTVTCHGPWGANDADVFIRVSFEFPRSYSSTWVAGSAPYIELDKSPLIPSSNRAIMLDNLGDISENQRPCLESCLSFLRFGDAGKSLSRPPSPGSDDSSDDELSYPKQRAVANIMRRNDKNVAEPRTSQAVFCPNGQLVYFFRAPPRIIRNVAHELARPSLINSHSNVSGPSRPPGLLSDAVRQLAMASQDRANVFMESRRNHDAKDILRIMTNLLAYPVGHPKGVPNIPRLPDTSNTSYHVLDNRLNNVVIRDVINMDRVMAALFIYESPDGPAAVCRYNARVAGKQHGYAEERIFSMLAPMCQSSSGRPTSLSNAVGVARIITILYEDLVACKDLQMLAMLSVVLIQILPRSLPSTADTSLAQTPATQVTKEANKDYFSVRHRRDSRPSRLSPGWPSLPSMLGSSNSTPVPGTVNTSWGKGSWPSLFQNQNQQPNLQQPPELVPAQLNDGPVNESPGSPSGIPVPKRGRILPISEASTPKWPGHSTSSAWNSWAASRPSPLNRTPVSFSSAGHLRHRPRGSKQIVEEKVVPMNKRIRVVRIIEDTPNEELFPSHQRDQLIFHITAYCDLLFSWELYSQRAALLKLLHRFSGHIQMGSETLYHHDIVIGLSEPAARQTRSALPRPSCAVCHLPVKALSHVCSRCSHVCHITCWQQRAWDSCPEGCGCNCTSATSLSVPASEIAQSLHSNLS